MSSVAIISDTIACLPPELAREYDIRIVPTGLVIDGASYTDASLTSEEFWKLFYGAKKITTTAVIPSDFAAAITDAAQSADSIVCITVSKALSATHEAAVQARATLAWEQPGLNIEVIDSKTASGAEGFIVLEAARVAREGKSLEAVVRVARDMVPRVKFAVALETLKYLIKSGRAPKTALIGDVLQVKPIIGMVTGTGLVESLGRARGKRKAMDKLSEMVSTHADTSRPMHLMFHYTDDRAAAEELRDAITGGLDCAEVYLSPYTPVMASQTGPLVAVAFYS